MVKTAGAKPTPHTPDGHADLSGIWLLPGIVSNAFGYGGPPGEVSQDGKEHTSTAEGSWANRPRPTSPPTISRNSRPSVITYTPTRILLPHPRNTPWTHTPPP